MRGGRRTRRSRRLTWDGAVGGGADVFPKHNAIVHDVIDTGAVVLGAAAGAGLCAVTGGIGCVVDAELLGGGLLGEGSIFAGVNLAATAGAAAAGGVMSGVKYGVTSRKPTLGGYVTAELEGAVENGVMRAAQTYAITNGNGAYDSMPGALGVWPVVGSSSFWLLRVVLFLRACRRPACRAVGGRVHGPAGVRSWGLRCSCWPGWGVGHGDDGGRDPGDGVGRSRVREGRG